MNHQFKFSFYSNVRTVKPKRSVTPIELVEIISKDQKIKTICAKINQVLEDTNLTPEEIETETQKLKKNLPCVTASLLSDSRKRSDPLGSHSGFIQVDVDMKDNPDNSYPELREIVESQPSTCLAFRSPRGGVKALLRVPQVPGDQLTKESNHAANATIRAWFLDRGVALDDMKDVKKVCYISHDPEPYYRDPSLVEEMDIIADPLFQEGSDGRIEYRVKGIELSVQINPQREMEEDPFDTSLKCKDQFKQDHPELFRIYMKHIEFKFDAIQGQRNNTLLRLVNYLYQTVPEKHIHALAMAFYDFNAFEFLDTRKEHEENVEAMMLRLPDLWRESLSSSELEALQKLNGSARMISAFRVCRALAHYAPATDRAKKKWGSMEPLCFTLSEGELERRIGIKGNGGKILRSFKNKKFVQVLKLGTQNKTIKDENGKRKVKVGNPTIWKWLLPFTNPKKH